MLHTLLSRVADSTVPWYRRGTVLWNRSGEIEDLRDAAFVLGCAYLRLDKATSFIGVNAIQNAADSAEMVVECGERAKIVPSLVILQNKFNNHCQKSGDATVLIKFRLRAVCPVPPQGRARSFDECS